MKAVKAFIQKHQLLKKGSTVLVGVSGGPDSMALLHYLVSIGKDWELELVALTVDHQLRGDESAADADYVESRCQDWGIRCERASVDVKSYKKERGIGTQTAARELRYRFFQKQMELYKADYLALGHHGDDQAETMLMQFTRSADPSAVAGIPAKRPFACGHIIRPFLAIDREMIESYCRTESIIPRLDPSNEDTGYTRNYFRKLVIPLLKEKNPNIHVTMQNMSERMQENASFLREAAEERLLKFLELDKKNASASFPSSVFQACPIALQRQMYQLILNYLYKKQPDQLSYLHETEFFKLLEGNRSNALLDFPNGLQVKKSYDRISLSFNKKEGDQSFEFRLEVPGRVQLPNGAFIEAFLSDQAVQDTYSFSLQVTSAMLPFTIRNRRAGDRMNWQGLNGSRKLKDLFIDEKIPREKRDCWPVITDASGRILWLPGLRKAVMPAEGEGNMVCLKYID
ncbi:tRNA lysidine(34) synthetase TilS [Aciduricibacillus chroicocephali]|uniref:tRNA(Ile)-lysidine synthase n=1 Tax=Aciduricibacillus chroicocephali TaxID=3054939 RepID=A0ABY9KV58_9BACI|nr:tRNA lysidine(34) synthetase TilS [Bacillaceae bacterium 44XB]